MRTSRLWTTASVLALAWSGCAAAQDTAPPATPSGGEAKPKIEKVVVTAERRSTALQKTPIAATVLTGEDLENKGINNVDQLQFVSPNATVNNFGQGIDFNIRGIGKAEHNTQTTTGVITYRDGVATFPGYFTAEPYYDIARVEILRGPQGTFVGQNATGGAVFVTSNSPAIDGGTHGYIAGQYGNYRDVAAQGAMNIPINETLAARVAFNVEDRDSFYNISGPNTGNSGLSMGSARIGVLWQPTAQLSALFKTDYNYLDFGGYPSDPVLATNDPFNISGNAENFARDRFVRSSLKIDYLFEDGTTLRSVSGYQTGNSAYRADLDGRNGPAPTDHWTFRDSVDETIWSQEINLISPDDARIRWILGAYYQTDEYNFLPGQFVIGVPSPVEYRLQGTNPKRAEAVFGQVGFNLFENVELQLGARYSDHKTTNHVSVSQYGIPIQQDQSASFQDWSGKVSLNWTVNEHNFVYGFAATGFRPGGLNLPVFLFSLLNLEPFDEEKVKSYEVGWKSGFLDGHLRTQLDAYYNEYDNFQVIVGYPQLAFFGQELNVPNTTTMYGFEAQAEAVFGAFSLDAGLGLSHSELGKFFAIDPRVAVFASCDPKTGPASAACIDLTGNEQTYAPEFTFNIGAQYVFDLGNGDTLTPRLNYGHVSKQWATLFENEARGDLVEARDIFNAQLAFTHDDIVATIYSTNLTDEHYVGAVNSGLRFAGPPRQFGLRVAKAF